ncbi:MAG: hypothetical protein JKX68_07080 [Flavobacteriales bacterium]|nr:hypothetical protein [Flavobacteriales bacterium]
MKKLINISGQQFYYSTVDQVIERCSQKEKCAVIIDESHLDEFLAKGKNIIGECVDQIIIISESVDTALSQLEGVSVLLIAAGSFEEAVRVVILGTALTKEVVCIPKEDESSVGQIIDIIVT